MYILYRSYTCGVLWQPGGGQRRLTAYELAERAGHTKAFVSWIAELNRPSKQLLLNRLFKHV